MKKSKKAFNSQNIQKTVFKAVGEILLVVLGILIALQIDNWNEDRKTKKQEIIILQEIQSNLKLDLARLNRNLLSLKTNLNSIEVLKYCLENKLPYHDSLNQHFGSIIRYGHFPPNISGYELLKSKGLEVISNTELRRDITTLYERYYAYIHTLEEERYRYNYSVVINQLQTKFRDNKILESCTPINYESLVEDREFMEILNLTYSINSYVVNNDYTKTRDLVSTLIGSIEEELKNREREDWSL